MREILIWFARRFDAIQLGLARFYWGLRLGSFGKGSKISSTVKIYQASRVFIGDNVVLNDFVHIWGGGGLEIGDNTLIAAHCVITSQSHDVNALSAGKMYSETAVAAKVRIGRNVWFGSNCTIVPGVTIGDNSVIGAGSVVTKDIPANSLAFGIPAIVKRDLSV